MKYIRNECFEQYDLCEEKSAIYDPETDTVYNFDESGTEILKLLDKNPSLEYVLAALFAKYGTDDDIRKDVEDFIYDLVEKKVVIAVEN